MDARFFMEAKMAASSVTGVGLGDSNGKQKPHLHSGCGCYPVNKTVSTSSSKKTYKCHTKYNYCFSSKYKSNSKLINNNSCF